MPSKYTVHGLLALEEKAFDDALFEYLKDGKRKVDDEDVWRSPAVAERTLEGLGRLWTRFEAGASKPTANLAFLAKMAKRIDAERAAVRPVAAQMREERLSRLRGKGPRHRAMVWLSKQPDLQKRFLDRVRYEQERDREMGRDTANEG